MTNRQVKQSLCKSQHAPQTQEYGFIILCRSLLLVCIVLLACIGLFPNVRIYLIFGSQEVGRDFCHGIQFDTVVGDVLR